MEHKTHYRWCVVCSAFYLIDGTKEHICYFNDNLFCEYNMFNITERGTAIYYCTYCSKITRWNQQVKCTAKEFSIICQFQIPRPYFCDRIDCSLHPGMVSIFCSKHPNFHEANIIEYDYHFYQHQPFNQCFYCGETKEQNNATYCHERMNLENLQDYLNKFPLLHRSRIKINPNVIWEMGLIDKNVS